MTVVRLAKRVLPPSYNGVARLTSDGVVLGRDGELMVGTRMLLDALPAPVWRI